jgi:hypothetical protein
LLDGRKEAIDVNREEEVIAGGDKCGRGRVTVTVMNNVKKKGQSILINYSCPKSAQ